MQETMPPKKTQPKHVTEFLYKTTPKNTPPVELYVQEKLKETQTIPLLSYNLKNKIISRSELLMANSDDLKIKLTHAMIEVVVA